MKTLFLNPNASAAVTQMMRERVAARRPPFAWEMQCVAGAPEVIASPADNAHAETVLRERLPALVAGWERLVLMSSLDTGCAVAAAALPGVRVRGFTRGVLQALAAQATRVHVLTFDAAMAPLYDALFATAGGAAVVASRTAFDAAPAALLRPGGQALRERLAAACDALHAADGRPVFIVGALALAVADVLRAHGRPWIVDPLASLLQSLSLENPP